MSITALVNRGTRSPIDDSALTDLYIFALGHELAAIKLSGHAADQCEDPIGSILLTDLTLMRLDELRSYPGPQLAPARMAQTELCRLFGPTRALDPESVRPVLRDLAASTDLLAAVLRFDRQGLELLLRLGPLLPHNSGRALVSAMRDAKERWVRLYVEIQENLQHQPRRWPWRAPN